MSADEVWLVGPEGQNIGYVRTDQALDLIVREGLNIEVQNPKGDTPTWHLRRPA